MEISQETIDEVARAGREYPDGVHTCAELQRLEPGRRPCTCGRCEMDDLARAHQWADALMDDENQDDTLILEGLLAMIMEIREGVPLSLEKYNRRYTYGH